MAFARLTDLRHNFSQTTFASYQHPLTQEKCNFGILEIMQPKRHFSKTVKITDFNDRVAHQNTSYGAIEKWRSLDSLIYGTIFLDHFCIIPASVNAGKM